jgi:hypothetical protein
MMLVMMAVFAGVVAASSRPAEARGIGSQPLDDIRFWADQKKACGLSRDQLAAMMLAVVYPEAGASGEQSPSPMTLSRYDTASGLYAFGDRNTPWRSAFWHPGIGLWAFDSAGGWNLTAASAISTYTAAEQAATTIAGRWCANPSRSYVWAPWYGCLNNVCEGIYHEIFDGNQLRNITLQPSVGRDGGMETRTCTLSGTPTTCWYVDPSRAQGANWWVNPAAGTSPISAPFYVVSIGGREARFWLSADTGFPLTIKADKPITANARTSLNWVTSADLCDTSAGRGDCGPGARVANTPWGPRTALPFGSLDVAVGGVGSVDIGGWVIDPDSNDPVDVHVYVDSQLLGIVAADASRPDVAALVPGYGDRHGFNARLGRVGAGQHEICVFAINLPPLGSTNPVFGCRTFDVAANPVGSFDGWVVSSPGIRVNGWAIDADTTAPLDVHVYVDNVIAGATAANAPRPDVGAVWPWAGPDHGWALEVNALPGPRTVCAYGINVGAGTNSVLGCKSIVVPDRNPFGSLDVAQRATSGTVRLAGWTMDPDTPLALDVHVYVNGAFVVALPAAGSRPDVGAAYPQLGPNHGFDLTVAAGPSAQICVFAINQGPGWGNPPIGCRTVG